MLYETLISAGVSIVICLLFYAGLRRSLWTVQCDLSTTQAQFLKLRNANAAGTRWKDKEQLQLLTDLQGQPKPTLPVNHLKKFGVGA